MEKSNKVFSKCALVSFLLIFISHAVNAQTRPKIQEVSVRAPANMKIDGKLLEWPNKLIAFNPDNRVAYEITNDDDNLYLTLRGPYFYTSAKLMYGGLTFTVSRSVDKKAKMKATDNITITFPVIDPKDASSIVSSINDFQPMQHDTVNRKREHDSLVRVVNAKTITAIKEINVTGIKEIPDTIISIYNTTGLKVAGAFDRAMYFNIEMAIPLKYLGFSVNEATKFSYNIKLKGQKVAPPSDGGPDGIITTGSTSVQAAMALDDFDYVHKPTDFWGEYTLWRIWNH